MQSAFSTALVEILSAESPEDRRRALQVSLRERGVVGLALLQHPVGRLEEEGISLEWYRDFTGRVEDVMPEIFSDMIQDTPGWLSRWIFNRGKPFWLGYFSRFIPFSSRVLLRATAPKGEASLVDLVIVPFKTDHTQVHAGHGLFVSSEPFHGR